MLSTTPFDGIARIRDKAGRPTRRGERIDRLKAFPRRRLICNAAVPPACKGTGETALSQVYRSPAMGPDISSRATRDSRELVSAAEPVHTYRSRLISFNFPASCSQCLTVQPGLDLSAGQSAGCHHRVTAGYRFSSAVSPATSDSRKLVIIFDSNRIPSWEPWPLAK